MQLSFRSKKIRDICENDAFAKKLYSFPTVKALQKRLADLQSGKNIYDQPWKTTSIKDGTKKIKLTQDADLIFSANHNTNPKLEDGRINWKLVTRIQIIKIEINA